ncbi:hypothetical protein AB4279_07775 [Vibrio cyclitrophicus]
MKNVFLLLILISLNANADFKTLNIFTSLDIGKLYINSITSVEFTPSSLNLVSSKDKTKFDDISTMLRIKTNIPLGTANIPYIATVNKNISRCIDYSGSVHFQNEDFTKISIDGQSIAEHESVAFTDFNLNDGVNKYSEHNVMFSFAPFKNINTAGQPERCDGEIEFNIEVDI